MKMMQVMLLQKFESNPKRFCPTCRLLLADTHAHIYIYIYAVLKVRLYVAVVAFASIFRMPGLPCPRRAATFWGT